MKYVTCFQQFPSKGLTAPFEAPILKDLGSYWLLKHKKHQLRANKGACSTVPYELKEKGTQQYREKVEAVKGTSHAPGQDYFPTPQQAPRSNKAGNEQRKDRDTRSHSSRSSVQPRIHFALPERRADSKGRQGNPRPASRHSNRSVRHSDIHNDIPVLFPRWGKR